MYYLISFAYKGTEEIRIFPHGDGRGGGQLSGLLHIGKQLPGLDIHAIPAKPVPHADAQRDHGNMIAFVELRA